MHTDYKEKEDKEISVMSIEPTKDVVNCLLSVSRKKYGFECVRETNVGLFLVVQDVDVNKKVSFQIVFVNELTVRKYKQVNV